ncbi:hypothetical protein E7T09_04205 [Deinococcus sp. KSM4-11]|uniref:DUF7669 domain-containing protein n=1 Tax=Deinococcus sp. KSM4-11 TaxID=2568654 RepID=UPI0010A445CF|nr:hypothetical protein [Deinococcus sp. KSM4-11]THF88416.1 hypothetical protein E7T09_04205 [Deinococcus sp. KSM4-11]
MTYRDEILDVVRDLVRDRPTRQFTLAEVIVEMQERGSACKIPTINTYVSSMMCVNAPRHRRKQYADFERVGPGQYRLL